MNRRQFFITLGLPALALPVVKLLGLPKENSHIRIKQSGYYEITFTVTSGSFESLELLRMPEWKRGLLFGNKID